MAADAGAAYDDEVEVDLRTLEPLVAQPHSPDHVVPVGELDLKVKERAEKLMAAAPGAQAAIKALLPQVVHRTPAEVLDLTARATAARRATEEGQEGLKAFLEKRKPAWQA